MRFSTILIAVAAAVFGLAAVALTKGYIDNQRELIADAAKSKVTDTLVVAGESLRFGQRLTSDVLREVPWPSENKPAGSFSTVEEMVKDGERFALTPIEAAEPVLNSKITGPGQRATLSATISDGMKAMSIRINDVNGVAGFVLPGDRVDVLLTRSDDSGTFVDVLLQGVRVIAIDQIADERAEKPAVVRTVTFEVNTEMAQRLTLAQAVGTLSLALRQVASPTLEKTRRISLTDLTGEDAARLAMAAEATASSADAERIEVDGRFRQIEELVTEVGSSLGNRIEGIKEELIKQPVEPLQSRVSVVNVYRNSERTEYRVDGE